MTSVRHSRAVPEAQLEAPPQPAPPPPVHSRRNAGRVIVLLLCILVVLGVYTRSAQSYGKSLGASDRGDFQNYQADAFLAGQLDLVFEPPPGLVALPDPYDPVANASYRRAGLHDLSYANGKLYTYNGPAPVLLLYIPYRALGVGDLSPALACLIFCAGGFLASVRAFQLAARFFIGELGLGTEAVAVVALGLAGPAAWLVYIGRAYEVSIACGYFMVATGLYFLARALFTASRHPLVDLAVAGSFLAGSIAARPSLVWTLLFVAFAVVFIWSDSTSAPIDWRTAIVAVTAPCLVIGIGLAWYNWARFGSVGEFGTGYMLLGENVRLARANELAFLRRGAFEYLLSPPRHEGGFPWFRLRFASLTYPTEQNYLLEPVAGLLPIMPAVLMGIVAFLLAPWRWLRAHRWLTLFVLTAALDGFLILATVSFHFHGATMRYAMDFTPPLLLASVLGGVAWIDRLRGQPAFRLAAGAALLVVAWSVFFALTITSYPCAGTGSC